MLLVPPMVLGGEWSEWLYRSLVLLVIACPCALVISTLVSVVAALAAAAGRTVVVIGNDEHVCGFISLADAIREEFREVVNQLHAAGIEHIIMLAGDNEGTANAIANQAGIDEVS